MQRLDEDLTYDYLHSSEDNLWSIMYLTGYLTKMKDELVKENVPAGMSALKIPNAEIKEIFQTTIMKWFDDSARAWNRQKLFDAVWNADSEQLTAEMTALLRKTISYHDYKEDFYHAFLAGIFAGAGYIVESNKEHGEGRSDVVVSDTINARIAIFEVKYSTALEKMSAACDAALRQPPTLTEERSKFFDALEQLPFQQVRTRYLSAVQHREGVGQRLRELLHRGGKEKKS